MKNIYFINGKVKWAVVLKPRPKFESEETEYSINIIVDDNNRDQIKKMLSETGAKNTIIKDKDGDEVIKIRRKGSFEIKRGPNKGQKMEFSPPKIYLADGSVAVDTAIGNGSLCGVMVAAKAFGTTGRTMVGLSIASIKIIDLVPYESKEKAVPKQVSKETRQIKKVVDEEDDDLVF